MTDSSADDATTVLVMNSQSGSGKHGQAVRERATVLGYDLVETGRAEHAVELARTAATEGADVIVAVGDTGHFLPLSKGPVPPTAQGDRTVL